MLRAKFLVVLAAGLVLAIPGFSRADGLEAISSEVVSLYAQALSQLFEKENPERPLKFEIDSAQASGLHDGPDGLITVPVKDLKEGNVSPDVEKEQGAGICYLFLSKCYNPIINGQPIDPKKLHLIKYNDQNGEAKEALCLALSVKHVSGDDWRLLGFGPDKTPVLNTQFGLATETSKQNLAMKVSDAKNMKADLTYILYGKYSASFEIGHK